MFQIIPQQFEDEEKKFLTYFNYVCALSNYVATNIEQVDELLANINSTKCYRQIQCKRKIVDIKKIEVILRNSWFTEYQLTQLSKQDSYLPIALLWIPVQAYYSSYLMARAYFLSQNHEASPNHQPTLNSVANEIMFRKSLFTYPWIMMCIGNDKSPVFLNQIEESTIGSNSLLSSNSQLKYIETFKIFLKTTREREIERIIKQYKHDNNIKKLSSIKKQEIIDSIAPTTIFDCLYRLRIRSNYETADSFMFYDVSIEKAKQYQTAFSNIIWGNHLLFENLIMKYLSVNPYKSIVDTFSSSFARCENELNPVARFELIKKHYA